MLPENPKPNAVQTIENTPPSSDPMVNMIERIVLEPTASIEKLERVIALKIQLEDREREERAREEKQAYFRAMAECQAELKVVTKNQENTHTHSTYADLAAIAKEADPVIHKHGFTVSFQPAGTNEKGDILIKWTIAHQDGHIETDIAAIPLDSAGSQGKINKTSTQAFGSTMSYGRRYLKLALFDIATGDDDGNPTQKSDPISETQLARIKTLMRETNTNESDVLNHFGLDRIEDLPQARYVELMTIFANKRKHQDKQKPA